jgi:hypothetical protein
VARAIKTESEAFVAATTGTDGWPTTVLGAADDRTAAMPADLGSTRVMPQGLLPDRRPVSEAAGGVGVGAAAGAAAMAGAARRDAVGGVSDLVAAPAVAQGRRRSVTGRAAGAARPAPPSVQPAYAPELTNPARVTGYRGIFLAAGLALVALAATLPGIAVAVLVALMIAARLAGIAADDFRNRCARRGPGRADALVVTLASPWHLVRAVFGVLPAAAVGICVGVIVVLLGLVVFAPGNVILVPVPTVEARSVGGMNEPVVDSMVLSVAMLVTVVVAWWGPASYGTRVGVGPLLRRIAPSRASKVVIALVLLALAVVAAAPLFDGDVDILWWPLANRPDVVW